MRPRERLSRCVHLAEQTPGDPCEQRICVWIAPVLACLQELGDRPDVRKQLAVALDLSCCELGESPSLRRELLLRLELNEAADTSAGREVEVRMVVIPQPHSPDHQ